MTHPPKIPFCDVCSKAKIQCKQKRKKVPKLVPDEGAKIPPTKFGEQVTGGQFIKSGRGDVADEEDPHFPHRHGSGSTVRQRHEVANSLPGSYQDALPHA